MKQDWYERDGERVMRDVLAELRTHTIVMVNERSSYLRPKTKSHSLSALLANASLQSQPFSLFLRQRSASRCPRSCPPLPG